MRNSRTRSHYHVLQVAHDASSEVICAAYRTVMSKLRAHPDLGGDASLAALINEAYDTLRDPGRRALYDASLPAARQLSQRLPDPQQWIRPSGHKPRRNQRRLVQGKTAWLSGFGLSNSTQIVLIDISPNGAKILFPRDSHLPPSIRLLGEDFEAEGRIVWRKRRSRTVPLWSEAGIAFFHFTAVAPRMFISLRT